MKQGRSLYKQKMTIFSLTLSIMLSAINSQLVNIEVSVSPNEAHGENTVFTLYASLYETMEQGSKLWMFIPQEVAQFQNGLSDQCNFLSPTFGVTASCSYQTENDGRILYKIEDISPEIEYGEDIQITIENFQNPVSTAETESFEIQLYGSNGAMIETNTVDIYLLLTASDLSDTMTLSSSSDIVGDKEATLTFKFTLNHDIEYGQYIAVTFPYITDEAPNPQKVSVLLSGASSTIYSISSNLPTNMPLEWDEDTQTLYILVNALVVGEVEFAIYPIHNPISLAKLTGFVVTTTTAEKDGAIETTAGNDIYMKVYKPYPIQNDELQLLLSETKVQNHAVYTIIITIDLPIESGSIFELSFPIDHYTFDDEFTEIFGGGGSSGGALQTSTIEQEEYTKITITTSGSYVNNNVAFVKRFTSILNNFYSTTTDSILVSIYDKNMNKIAENTAGLEAEITTGQIYLLDLDAHPSEYVMDETYLHFHIQPENDLSSDSKLVITFPAEIGLELPANCVLSDFGTLVRSDINCVSDTSALTLTLTKIFRQDYTYDSDVYIEFDVKDVKLPVSSKPFGTMYFEFYTMTDDGTYQLVDIGSQSDLYTPLVREMAFASAEALNKMVYEEGEYLFTIQLSAFIPQGGQIKVEMSEDVQISSSSQCYDFSSQFSSSAYCEVDTGTNSVQLHDIFTSSDYDDTDDLSFTVSKIRNPRSKKPSTYFKLYTMDSFGYYIEQSLESAFVEMEEVPYIREASIDSDSLVVGDDTEYFFQIQAKVPIYEGDFVEITIPAQFINYIGQTLDYCEGIQRLEDDLACFETSSTTLNVYLVPQGDQVQENRNFKFMVSELTNPNSTAQTENFNLKIYDSGLNLMTVSDPDDDLSVKMEEPCPLDYAWVTHSSKMAYETTLFSFTIRLIHELPPESQIKVEWPDQIEEDEDADFECSISTRIDGLPKPCRPRSNYVILEDINDEYLSSGKTIQLSIYGLRNSKFAEATDSFIVTTMVDRYIEVDQAAEGLTVVNNCDWPCKSCDSNDPSVCWTCSSTSDYNIFYDNECLRECPRDGGLFEANLRCNECDESCEECDGAPNYCTSCKPGTYLLGHTCYDECPSNSIPYEYGALCALCESPCETCETTVDTCTSCVLSAERRYFWEGECRTECPADITVYVGPDSFCTPCDDNCATCYDQPDVCQTCKDGMKLDITDYKCKETCPEGISVDMGSTCEPCDSLCATCSSSAKDECLACYTGTIFLEEELTCVTECPTGSAKMLEDNTPKCVNCDEGCLECINGDTSYCTSCDDSLGYLFFQFSCVADECPEGFKRLSETRNTCIPSNEYCKYGYDYNDYGICELAVAECPEGTVLNEAKDKCVALPGLQIPFLFLGLSLIWTTYVLATSFKRDKSALNIVPQLILGYDVILQFCSIFLIYLCSLIGLDLLSTVNLSILVFVVFENMALTIWIQRRSMLEDQAFKYWCQYNQGATSTILAFTAVWSFKSARAFYSKAFSGSKHFSAAFDRKFQTIVRPLFLVSMVHFLCLQLPLVMTDIYTIAVMPARYRYEISTVALDNLVLQLTIFALEIYEFTMMRAKAKKTGSGEKEFLPAFKRMRREAIEQIQVKSAYQRDSDREEDSLQVSRMDMDQSQLPLNILDWNNAKSHRYKENQHRLSKQMPSRQSSKTPKQSEETLLLESIVTKLTQKKKFKELSSIQNIPETHKFQFPMSRKTRIDIIKANKQKFSLIKRRKFVIRDRVKPIEISPRSDEDEGQVKVQFEVSKNESNLEKINTVSREEQRVDRRDYKNYLREYKEIEKKECQVKVQSGETRLNKSFDDEIMRADYEFMGDDLSQYKSDDNDSVMTFPLCKDDHRIDLNDPREMADLDVFRERIKRKFQYNNCAVETQEKEIFRLPAAKETQTQGVEAKDPFDSSDGSLSDISYAFSDDIEEQLYNLSNQVAQNLIETVIHDGVSESEQSFSADSIHSDSKSQRRQKTIDQLKLDSYVFSQKMRASEQRFEEIQRQGGQILQDHLDPAVQRLASESSMRSAQMTPMRPQSKQEPTRRASLMSGVAQSVVSALSLKDIVAIKLREQVEKTKKEMNEQGLDDDQISDEELRIVRSEMERLQELSLGKPSVDEDDEKIKDTAVNDEEESVGASDFQKFSAISKAKTKSKNKRIQRLENAYGKKKKNYEIMSMKNDSKREKRKQNQTKNSKMSKHKAIDELFPELADQERQITARHQLSQLNKEQSQIIPSHQSSRSSNNFGFRGSLHSNGANKFDHQNNQEMKDFISGQINQVMAKRDQNKEVGQDLMEADLIDQEQLNLDQEMNDILQNVESPKEFNVDQFKDLWGATEPKHFPTTQKKPHNENLNDDSYRQKSKRFSIDDEWGGLDMSDLDKSSIKKSENKVQRFNKFEHLIYENIIEQKVENEINKEKKRLETEKEQEFEAGPKAIAFYSSKKILDEKPITFKKDASQIGQQSKINNNSLMRSQLGRSKIDSIKDIYNSTKPYYPSQSKSKNERSVMNGTQTNQFKQNSLMVLNGSRSNQQLPEIIHDADSARPYQMKNKESSFLSNRKNSEVLLNRSTSALGQPRGGLSQIMKHNFINQNSSGLLPPYKPDRAVMSDQSDGIGGLDDANISDGSSKLFSHVKPSISLTSKKPQNIESAIAQFSYGRQVARDQARKQNAEEILKK